MESPPASPADTVTSEPDYGDYIDDVDLKVAECEYYDLYSSPDGSYLPISIGELLHGRYLVEHKLGWSGRYTLWLARDLDNDWLVTLKVFVDGGHGQHELRIAGKIRKKSNKPGNRALALPRNRFIWSPSGVVGADHVILVLPPLGPSLATSLGFYIKKTSQQRMSAAKQLLAALKDLHDIGIVHGDLNTEAVFWNLSPILETTRDQFYHLVGRPRKVYLEPSNNSHNKEGDLVEPIVFPQDIVEGTIRLGNFQHSIQAGESVANTAEQEFQGCAPERMHNVQPSFASDMWSFMYLFTQLYSDDGDPLFGGRGPGHVSSMICALGQFPKEWRGKYVGACCDFDQFYNIHDDSRHAKDWWYKDDLDPYRLDFEPHLHTPLEDALVRRKPDITLGEMGLMLSILRKGFHYDPKKRITAAQLLADPDFKALMEMYGV